MVFIPRQEHNLHAAQWIEVVPILQIWEKIYRTVEINSIVVIPVSKELKLILAAHRHSAMKELRIFTCKVHRMISAEAATGDGERTGIPAANEGDEFLQDIALVLAVTFRSGGKGNALVVPALDIDAVDAKELNAAAV